MLKISFEKPKIAEEVERFLKKGDGRKKKEERKSWSHKERLLVGALLALTVILSIYFWLKGAGHLPEVVLPKPEFGETIILD